MIKSMDSAVSAIKAQQAKLDVTANNIANVNTVGFKKGRVVFSTMLNNVMRTASGATANRGGINPATIGMGVQVSSIDTIHTDGVLTSTGRDLDLAIKGEGFFSVTDGISQYYTRNGAVNFSPEDGSLSLANGYKLVGYPVDENGLINKTNGLQPIVIPNKSSISVQPTTEIEFIGNFNSSDNIGDIVNVQYPTYDSLGNKHDLTMTLTMTANGADFTVTHEDGLAVTGGVGSFSFDTSGKIDLASITGGPVSFNPIGAEPVSIDVNLDNITRVNKNTDFSMKSQNGMPAGNVQGISVTEGGNITVVYSNGISKDIASLGIAQFDNPAGLLATEDSMFSSTQNSGEPVIVAGGESASSTVVSSYLEGSNVDVSEELTDMIKTQRAYQMATKVITTSDELLQELTNIKR